MLVHQDVLGDNSNGFNCSIIVVVGENSLLPVTWKITSYEKHKKKGVSEPNSRHGMKKATAATMPPQIINTCLVFADCTCW